MLREDSGTFGASCSVILRSLTDTGSSVVLLHLLDLVEAGHGDVGLVLLIPSKLHLVNSAELFRLRGERSLLDGRRAAARDAVLAVGGAPAQQGGELQLLGADTRGALAVGALGGAGMRTIGGSRTD